MIGAAVVSAGQVGVSEAESVVGVLVGLPVAVACPLGLRWHIETLPSVGTGPPTLSGPRAY